MARRYLLGFDVGSSSVKASLTDVDSGAIAASAFYPEHEAPIMAVKAGWAEQDPQMWWDNAKLSLRKIMNETGARGEDILAVGISYQMHGLVCVDKDQQVLRPSIIWCDSRAVPYGERAFRELGEDLCLRNLLNSPGNFTAAKLAWVKENEPALFDRIDKIMLPGDYIAMKLSGEVKTTISGLSEGMMWDFTCSTTSASPRAYCPRWCPHSPCRAWWAKPQPTNWASRRARPSAIAPATNPTMP